MRRLLIGLVALGTVSCFSNIEGTSTVTGTYTLRTINGVAPPVTPTGSTTQVVDDAYTLFQGNTYSQTAHTRASATGSIATTTASGSYGLQGTSVTFTNGVTGAQSVAIINVNTMTFLVAGTTSIYMK